MVYFRLPEGYVCREGRFPLPKNCSPFPPKHDTSAPAGEPLALI